MKKLILFFLILFVNNLANAQDTLKVEAVVKDTLTAHVPVADTLLNSEEESLLPENYLFTQRLLWGKKGLMRNFNVFELSEDSRNLEMNIRSYTVRAHQYLGYASLLSMIGAGITGQQLYKGNERNKDLHETFAGLSNVFYFSSAAIALFQPPVMHDRAKGFTKFRIHRVLSVIHLSSMIATNLLSELQEDNPGLKPYHKAAAITAFSSLFLATVVIKF